MSLLNLNVLPGFPLLVSLPCGLLVLPILVALFFYFVILILCVVPSRILQVALCVVSLILMVYLLTLFLFIRVRAKLMAGGHAFDAFRLFCLFLFLSSTLHKETSPNDSALVFHPRFSILHRRSAALKLPAVKESKRGLLFLALPFNNHVTLSAYFAICCLFESWS